MSGIGLVAGALIGVMVLSILLLFSFQRRLIYPAPNVTVHIVASGFLPVVLHTADGLALTALYRPAARQRPTIIFFHGNGDSLSGSLLATAGLAKAGYGLLLPEYRGYGGNLGSPTEDGLYADADSAVAFLRSHAIQQADTFAIGNSLGSGPATELAANKLAAGLVIVSGYTSMPDVVASKFPGLPIKVLVRDRFANLEKLKQMSLPVLVLHGNADRVIPVTQGRTLGRADQHTVYREFAGYGHELAYRMQAQTVIESWLERRRAPPTLQPAFHGG